MEEIYRCSNCGSVIKKNTKVCPYCGYVREVRKRERYYEVYLIEPGKEVDKLIEVLKKEKRMTTREAQYLINSAPILIHKTDNYEEAQKIANQLKATGAYVELTEYKEKPKLVEVVKPPANIKKGKKFSLISNLIYLLIFLLLIILPNIPNAKKDIKRIAKDVFNIDLKFPEEVLKAEVLIAKSNLRPQHIFKKDDFIIKKLNIKNIPTDAIPPIYLNKFLNNKIKFPIRRGQIIRFYHFGYKFKLEPVAQK